MQIRGEPKDRVEFICGVLGIKEADITIVKTCLKGFSAECHKHDDGTFTLLLDLSLDPTQEIKAMGHELVHVRQYISGELQDLDDNRVLWKDKTYYISMEMDDTYYLSPWEMEARALEAWIAYRWETRHELHGRAN